MISKTKEFLLLISLILLQSCSGGRIGIFLESSFDNLENNNSLEEIKNDKEKKKVLNSGNKENNKSNLKKTKKQINSINISDKKISLNSENNVNNVNNEQVKKEKNSINDLNNKKLFNSEKKLDKTKEIIKDNKSLKKKKIELQSYKIIFILKDVDPKDPIKELSTILRNSEVNFEIEKIERFIDSKNKNNNRN